MSRRVVMTAHGVMCDIRYPRQEDISAARAERDLVARRVGPWISEETDVVYMLGR